MTESNLKRIVVKGFFWMFLAGLIVNSIQFLAKILLARWLNPADFGVVAIVISIVGVLAFFQDLGLGTTLIQRKTDIDESFNSVFIFTAFLSSIFAICLLLFSPQLASYFQDDRINTVGKLIAMTLPLSAMSLSWASYLSKNLLFFRRFITDTIPFLLGSAVSLFLAYHNQGYLSLTWGYIIGSTSYAILLFILTPWKPKFKFNLTVFKQMISYSKYILFVNIAAIILSQGDNFVVGKMLGSTNLGYYAIAYTIATLPAVNVAHLISKVVFPTFAKLQDNSTQLTKSFIRSMSLISSAAFPITAGTILISPFLFKVLISDKWLPAHLPLIILSFLSLFKSLQVIPSFFLQATGHSKQDSKIMVSSSLLGAVFIIPLTYFQGILGASIAVTLAYGYGTICQIIRSSKILNISTTTISKSFLPAIISSIVMILSGFLTMSYLNNQYTLSNLFILVTSCVTVYLTITYLINKRTISDFTGLISNFFNRNQ